MERLNDILSNSRQPARQSAADRGDHSDYRLSSQRLNSPTHKAYQGQQERRQHQPSTTDQDTAMPRERYQPPTPQQRPPRYYQRPANDQLNQQRNNTGPRREPTTGTDYPTYPPYTDQPLEEDQDDRDPHYRTPQSWSSPHQERPHLQPLQPGPINDYYVSHRNTDDYTAPLHDDVLDDNGWENGMVYGDFEVDNADPHLYESEEVEELAEDQIGYQPPQQRPAEEEPPAPRQQSQPLPPIQQRQIPPQAPQTQDRQQTSQQDKPHSQRPGQLRGRQNAQNGSGQRTLNPGNLPRLTNLHDMRLASAIARQRASSQNPPYQRVTQPLNPATRINNLRPAEARPQKEEEEQALPPRRPMHSTQPPHMAQPTTEPIAPSLDTESEEEIIGESVTHAPAHIMRHLAPPDNEHEQKKTAILPEVSDDYALPAPKEVCPLCKGAGFLRANVPFGHPNFGKPIPCECKERERKEKRRQQLRVLSNLDDFRDRNFGNFNVGTTVIEAYQASCTFADDPYGWLVLVGPNGCGKTHLAAAIANQCLAQGSVVLFEAVPDLLDHLRAAFSPKAEDVYDQLFSKMREAELLVLDDLGAQQSTPWANEKLFQLLNYRYNREMPTVITANPKGIQAVDERIRSRLSDTALVAYISMDKARDYRPSRANDKKYQQ